MSEHPGKAEIDLIYSVLDTRDDPMGLPVKIHPDRFRSIASYVSDLEARLEKAEAERDRLGRKCDQLDVELGDMMDRAATARNDALEEAARKVREYVQRDPETGDEIAGFILSLKSKS